MKQLHDILNESGQNIATIQHDLAKSITNENWQIIDGVSGVTAVVEGNKLRTILKHIVGLVPNHYNVTVNGSIVCLMNEPFKLGNFFKINLVFNNQLQGIDQMLCIVTAILIVERDSRHRVITR
jgi:hypothetical protein